MSNPTKESGITRSQLLEILLDGLLLNVTTESSYTGGIDGGSLYREVHRLQLIFDGEVISEVTI